MRMNESEKALEREQQARVAAAAAAAADGRAAGRALTIPSREFTEFVGIIGKSTGSYVREVITAAAEPLRAQIRDLEARVVELEQRVYEEVWASDKRYVKGASVTFNNSLWIARSESHAVRPGTRSSCLPRAARTDHPLPHAAAGARPGLLRPGLLLAVERAVLTRLQLAIA